MYLVRKLLEKSLLAIEIKGKIKKFTIRKLHEVFQTPYPKNIFGLCNPNKDWPCLQAFNGRQPKHFGNKLSKHI